MSNLMKAFLIAIAASLVVLGNTLYVISDFERGITTRFGEIIESDIESGIFIKCRLLMKSLGLMRVF